ncbi:hypothetical protein [Anaerobranca gottschalkii]|uniref:Stage III sporulation protein AG n=1 Tax=Anaerobranca gottschalkii DSM 13577 TaxID=1120990 RepID=A0A1H9Y3J9_9FIRM|nr:hypothetical protein [Anaerobranca gottschalkii]SES62922.1 stage III sporulation protein AG [Anaerobranca gottschalkii DSM 13577]
MDNFKKVFSELKGKKNLSILLLAFLGIVLILFNFPSGKDPTPTSSNPKVENLETFELQIKKELENILSKMDGVGKVSVMVTLENSSEMIYSENYTESRRENREEDSQGGTRNTVEYNKTGQLVIIRRAGNEEPVVIKEIMPKIRGVMVVSENGDNPKVKLEITKAIQSVLDVPAYKISVVKGK